jgi:protoporphyrinogen/coproporphyrinogen III oxidase
LKGVFTSVIPEVDRLCTAVRQEINRVGIYYPPVAAVTVAYPKESFKDIELPNGFGNLRDLPGFGNLNPRTEGVRTLGTLWTSSLFPERAPADYNLLLNYIGGSRDTSIANMTNEEIINAVDKGCREVLLMSNAPPPKVLGLKVWPTAIPQYEKGHLPLIKQLEDAERSVPGLWICGNYRTGVAFPDCVTWGYDHSRIVAEYLQKIGSSSAGSSSNTVKSEQRITTKPAKAIASAAA